MALITDKNEVLGAYSTIKEYTVEQLSFNKVVNTELFSDAAKDYLKNEKAGKPVYCLAPLGSTENEMYWKEQEHRCRNGYKVGDLKISGRYYFYLNFFVMMRTPKDIDATRVVAEKIKSFPSFLLIQYLWWNFKSVAQAGGSFLGIKSNGGEDICCLKSRGAGFSYMDACDDVYNFEFIRDSKSYIFAYMGEYLDGADGIMPKIQDALDFLKQSTKSYLPNGKISENSRWGLQRYDLGSEPKEFKAGYKDLDGGIHGMGSQIISVIVDRPRKARGKRGRKITIEEAGSFPDLLTVLSTSKALVSDNGYKTGQIVMFGTGGEAGAGIEGLEEVFDNPQAHGMMAFPNIFGENVNDKVGFFCPMFMVSNKYKDKDGNPDVRTAVKVEQIERDIKKKLSSVTYDRHTAEYPFTPKEALKRLVGNNFPTVEINAQIARLKSDSHLLDSLIHCDLVLTKENKVIIEPNKNEPILIYPHNKNENYDSCVVIRQIPLNLGSEINPKIPPIYFITVDNFGVDNAEDKTSLFCAMVWKQYNNYDNTYSRVPVAWYRARPKKQAYSFYILMKMSMFYGNAKIYGEYNAQGTILINWFKNKKKASLIADSDIAFTDKDVVGKGKWEKITTDSKAANITLLSEYLLDERSYKLPDDYQEEEEDYNLYEHINIDIDSIDDTSDVNTLTNLREIHDIVWLIEMSVYKGQNADSISCSSLAMPLLTDKENKHKRNNQSIDKDLEFLDSLCDN